MQSSFQDDRGVSIIGMGDKEVNDVDSLVVKNAYGLWSLASRGSAR